MCPRPLVDLNREIILLQQQQRVHVCVCVCAHVGVYVLALGSTECRSVITVSSVEQHC